MIRHNSSNINPSIVNSPTIAERLTAAEGIRTDKPITGLNHVVNSVNFELSNDNTYILRKPLIYRTSVGWLNILTYNKDYELVCETDSDIYLINRETNTRITRFYFKATALNGTVYTESLESGNHIIGNIFTLHKDDVKVANTNSNTVFFNVQVDLDELERESELTFYDTDVITQADASSVTRILTLYEDEDGTWYLEMINPEMNTLTGDVESATNFNPNLALDNPYALRDLYNYGGNSVTQILPYTSKNSVNLESDYVLKYSGYVNIPLEQGLFEVQYSERDECVAVFTKHHILAFDPKGLKTPDADTFKSLNSAQNITLNVNGTWTGTGLESALNKTWNFRHFIPAGTLICKLSMPSSSLFQSCIVNITINMPNTFGYIINAKYAFEDFSEAKFFKHAFRPYQITFEKTDEGILPTNSLRYGLDLSFGDENFTLYTRTEITNSPYLTISKTQLSESEAKSKLVYFSDVEHAVVTTEPLAYYMYSWTPTVTSEVSNTLNVANLTERYSNPTYVLAESFNKNHTDVVLLKAFVTTQTDSSQYYCMWEVSKDGGETWDIAPEFIVKFKDSLVDIPVLDPTHSEESLDKADDYITNMRMAPFSYIEDSSDLVKERPDVLEISGTSIQNKYRFSIYKYKRASDSSKIVQVLNAHNCPTLKVSNSYITSSNQYETITVSTTISGSTVSDDYPLDFETVWLKYPKEYEDCVVKAFCSKNIQDNPEYSGIHYTTLPIIQQYSVTEPTGVYTYSKIRLNLHGTDVASWNYKIILTQGGIIYSDTLTNITYHKGGHTRFIDVNNKFVKNEYTIFYTFIPSIIYKVDSETCRFNTVTANTVNQDFDMEDAMSGTLTGNLKANTLQYVNYNISGILYNNTNFDQIVNIKQFMFGAGTLTGASEDENDVRERLNDLKASDVSCTLELGSKSLDIKYFNEAQLESTLTKSDEYYTLPAHSETKFTFAYRIGFKTDVNMPIISDLIFRGVMPLAFQTLSTSLIISSLNNSNWAVYYDGYYANLESPFAIYTSPYFTPTLVQVSTYTNLETDYTNNYRVVINNFYVDTTILKDSLINNAYLVSQKEYVFTITDGETVKLIPKNFKVLEGQPLYYNNSLLTYGIEGYKNKIYVSDTDSFIFPMFNTIDLTYGYDVTKIIPWRNYLAIFTEYDIYLASYDTESGMYTSKLINTNLGIPERDAETVVNVLNSIIFKSHNKIYKLVPNMYAATDSVMNTVCISIPIENYLDDSNFNNFAFSTNDNYYLFIPNTNYTMCYVYNYVKNAWTIHKYPVRLTSYDYINSTDIRVYSETKQFYFNKDLNEIFKLEHPVPYGDYLHINYDENTDSLDLDCETDVTPIEFSIDFGQKASKYADEKQFIETRINLETLSEKDMFPFNVTITTDGMPRSISTDITTDSALWKTSLSHIGTLSTQFVNNESESTGTLRQIMLKYSGRGKTIQHVIRGNSKFKFKFYSLDYKYRNLPNK